MAILSCLSKTTYSSLTKENLLLYYNIGQRITECSQKTRKGALWRCQRAPFLVALKGEAGFRGDACHRLVSCSHGAKNEPQPGEALWLLSLARYGILRTEQRKDFKRKVGIIPLFCLPGSFFCHVAASGTKPEER